MNVELSNAEQFINWIKTKVHLNKISTNAASRFVKRGQVYWCHFGINVGSEMSKSSPRPAVIVQNYLANRNSSNTIVVPVTHNMNALPCLVPLETIRDEAGNVVLDGQVNTANIVCVSKARLGDMITTLPAAKMKEIDKSIALSLELMHYFEDSQKKYEKLQVFVEKVKRDRNAAQDQVKQIKDIISEYGFNEDGQKMIKEILDI